MGGRADAGSLTACWRGNGRLASLALILGQALQPFDEIVDDLLPDLMGHIVFVILGGVAPLSKEV